MKTKGNNKKKFLSILLAVAMLVTMIPAAAFAGQDVEKEWYNFRNNQENNGVTDRATPQDPETAVLKWATKCADWFSGVTPPIIVDGYLYAGVGKKVIKVDKNTGKIVGESDELAGSQGWVMKPLLYADGKLFAQTSIGSIQAIDFKTLKCVWSTEAIGGEINSSISHTAVDGKGYIFANTANNNSDGALICVSTDDSNVNENKIKKTEWRFIPSGQTDTLKNLQYNDTKTTYDPELKKAAENNEPLARKDFYWAGIYACENYIAVGTDDGTGDFAGPQVGGCFYTLNPKTGEIIDKITDINGKVRTTTVYDNGYLYFCTKGGILYKVPVDASGNLGEAKTVNLGGEITATPVVYKGKIYMGVSGTGGQFDPNGGHRFAVIDANTMTELYGLPIAGYPQEGALLSTAYEGEDFDGDGQADGRVYLYFTYNAYPGGICYTWDATEKEDANTLGENLFTPDQNMQQYCISAVCADKDGTLYYKNDSGHLFAIKNSKAYLKGITIEGAKSWSREFASGTTSYEVKMAPRTKNTKIILSIPMGVTAKVNGDTYDSTKGAAIVLDKNGSATVKIVVTAEGGSTEYTLHISCQSNDSSLKNIAVSNSNTYGEGVYKLAPKFSADKTEYKVIVDQFNEKFYRIWPEAADKNATVNVSAIDNVEKINLSNNGQYYAVYQKDKTKAATVKIEVTSESGEKTTAYQVTICKPEPNITSGADSTWKPSDNSKGLTFRSDANFADFIKVLIDGKELSREFYTVTEGSTIVNVKPEYLKTLPAGEHTISIVSETGTAEASFTAAQTSAPKTGDSVNLTPWLALLAVMAAGTAFAVYKRKED